MSLQAELALLFTAGAVCMDLLTEKVSNRWIWLGLGAGICCQAGMHGARGFPLFLGGILVPLAILFPLFLFRMMGAGDVKLLAVLGGILGCQDILKGIGCIFLLGAVLSFAFLISCGNLRERFSYFFHYLRVCGQEGRVLPYTNLGNGAEFMHFTVPILLGIMLYAGGFY